MLPGCPTHLEFHALDGTLLVRTHQISKSNLVITLERVVERLTGIFIKKNRKG